MENIKVTLSVDQGSADVQLSVKNILDHCFFVSETPLMLNGGMEQEVFVVVDKITREELPYQGITAKHIPTYIKLESGQDMSSEVIHLNMDYNLEHDKSYEVYYRTMLTYAPCDKPTEIYMGLVESNHIDINYD
jgi:hypothetical protein